MSSFLSKRDKQFWLAVAVGLGVVGVGFWTTIPRKPASATGPMPIINPVADFTLTNQESLPVSLADLRGHVWLADVIFTRCGGPCPKMTRRMKDLQNMLPKESSARFVTLTTDPAYDTPPILKAYAEKFGADTSHWQFLTGPKTALAALARNSLLLTAIEKGAAERDSTNDLFLHSTIFVLVDKQARLRAVVETEGEDLDPTQVKARILSSIKQLEAEP